MSLSPGALVAGKYRVERQLGQGAMGEVWEATNTLTERGVALKVLTDQHRTPEAQGRILREARALGRIHCPNVIEIFDVGALDDGAPFLVMQLLKGESLEQRLDRLGRLPRDELTPVMLGVARALAAAHEVGIVHRDLKPGNVFLHWDPGASTFSVKVLDFGISKIITQRDATFTDAGRAVGSPAYMSPEQARGALDIDAGTDVWSFGILLFECLTGGLPFPGDTPYSMVAEILHGPAPNFAALCPQAGEPFMTILGRAVVRDRAARLPSAAALVALLEAKPGARPDAAAAPPPPFEASSDGERPFTVATTQKLATPAAPPRGKGGLRGLAIGVTLGVAIVVGGAATLLARRGEGSTRDVAAASANATAGGGLTAPAATAAPTIEPAPPGAAPPPDVAPSPAPTLSAAPASSSALPSPTPRRPPRTAPAAPRSTGGRVRLPDGPG